MKQLRIRMFVEARSIPSVFGEVDGVLIVMFWIVMLTLLFFAMM